MFLINCHKFLIYFKKINIYTIYHLGFHKTLWQPKLPERKSYVKVSYLPKNYLFRSKDYILWSW